MKKMLLMAFMLGGCATIPKAEQVKLRASQDFKCDQDQVQTRQVDAKTVHASACGQEATYVEECPFPDSTRCNWVSRDSVESASSGSGSGGTP